MRGALASRLEYCVIDRDKYELHVKRSEVSPAHWSVRKSIQ